MFNGVLMGGDSGGFYLPNDDFFFARFKIAIEEYFNVSRSNKIQLST